MSQHWEPPKGSDPVHHDEYISRRFVVLLFSFIGLISSCLIALVLYEAITHT